MPWRLKGIIHNPSFARSVLACAPFAMWAFLILGLVAAEMAMPEDECAGDCALNVLQLGALKTNQAARSDDPAGLKTSVYQRPKNHMDLNAKEFVAHETCKKPPCSGQVHLQLGGPGEMLVSFVSQPESDTASRVRYGTSSLEKEAVGTAETYSQLMFWREDLWDPPLKGVLGMFWKKVKISKPWFTHVHTSNVEDSLRTYIPNL